MFVQLHTGSLGTELFNLFNCEKNVEKSMMCFCSVLQKALSIENSLRQYSLLSQKVIIKDTKLCTV